MIDDYYTLALWKIKVGKREEFLNVWEKELTAAIIKFNPYSTGTLIQSLENPDIYYSFGAWANLEQMQSARSNVDVRSAILRLISLCDEARPGTFKKVLTVSGNK